VQRKVPRDGVIMVTRQRLRVGTTYAGKIVTVHRPGSSRSRMAGRACGYLGYDVLA
jgi:hypothetical protein